MKAGSWSRLLALQHPLEVLAQPLGKRGGKLSKAPGRQCGVPAHHWVPCAGAVPVGPLLPPAWGGRWGSLGEELNLQSCAVLSMGWEQMLGKAAAAHTEGWPSHFGSLKTLGGTEIPLCSLLL